jgi:hypothetical protein
LFLTGGSLITGGLTAIEKSLLANPCPQPEEFPVTTDSVNSDPDVYVCNGGGSAIILEGRVTSWQAPLNSSDGNSVISNTSFSFQIRALNGPNSIVSTKATVYVLEQVAVMSKLFGDLAECLQG